jgi:vacuolar-type H+-ATPase subunit H
LMYCVLMRPFAFDAPPDAPRRQAAISEGARREELERELEEAKRDADRIISEVKREADQTISEVKRDADRTISEVKRDADRIVSEAKMDAAEAAVQCVWLEENLRSSACRGDMGDRAGVASSGPLSQTDVSRADLCRVTPPSPALDDFEHVTSLVPEKVDHVTSFVPDEVDHVPPPDVVLADLAGCSAADHGVGPLAPRREIELRPVCLAALEDATPSPSSTPSSPSAGGAAAASAVAEPALAAATESKANARAIFHVEQPDAAGAGSREGWQSCAGSWRGSPGGGSAWGADSEVGQDGFDSFFSCGSRVPSP